MATDEGVEEDARPSWSDGELSSARLRRHMKNARTDGLLQPSIITLSNIGGAQSGEQHCHASLMKILDDIGVTSLITHVGDAETTHAVLPSTSIRIMFRHYEHEFKQRLGADAMKLEKFWADFFAEPIKKEWADSGA